MKKRYNGEEGSEVDAMEEADKAYRANKPSLKEMGDAGAAEEAGQFGDAGSSRTVKATPKAMPKAAPKPDMSEYKPRIRSEEMPSGSPGRGKFAEMPADVTKKSVAERAKENRDMARSGSGSTSDSRSVNERLRSAMGSSSDAVDKAKSIGSSISNYFSNFKTPAERKAQERKEKAAKGSYASGGSVSSASRRADGIATKGKTRGKMC
jgi:hypothetical protein